MAVTLKQIREKRARVAEIRAIKEAALKNLTAANLVQEKARTEYVAALETLNNETDKLERMGKQFALDEGEDAVQEKLNLPEQELPEIPEIDMSLEEKLVKQMFSDEKKYDEDIPF